MTEIKTGLAQLIGHQVSMQLMPAIGVGNYMTGRLQDFDAVSLHIADDFIPMMRILSIKHLLNRCYIPPEDGGPCTLIS